MRPDLSSDAAPIPSGVPGMDDILSGGYACNRAHLIEGRPGCGKTTLGLQFLLDGVRQGECCLYITLSESKRELTSVAERHGWSLDGVEIYELVPPELSLDPRQQQSLVHSSDLELGETVQMALAEVERVKPKLRKPRLYKVMLLNDDYTPMEFVVHVLENFFNMNREMATRVMLRVHTEGKAVCGVYTRDIAETKSEQINQYSLENEHPLLCQIEPDGNDSDDD